MTTATLPKPGLYARVPFDDYLDWDAMSATRLKDLARSPAYCRFRIDAQQESTRAQRLGTIKHAAVMEPDLFELKYAAFPLVDRRTKEGKAAYAEWQRLNADKEPLKAEEYESCVATRSSIRKNADAAALLDGALMREISAVWIDADHGIPCKGRFDLLLEDGTITDFKFARHASPDPDYFWRRFVAEYKTHQQAAHYLDGLRALGRPAKTFKIICVRQDAPYECCVLELSEDAIRCGRERNRKLRARYADCVKTGLWPGFQGGTISLEPPEWELRETFPEEYVPVDYSGLEVEKGGG